MRLSDDEKRAVIDAVKQIDPNAGIYLFGSRTDDAARGGDIDLLVLSRKITFEDKLNIKARIFEKIEEQKIDLVIADDFTDPFVKMAFENGVELE